MPSSTASTGSHGFGFGWKRTSPLRMPARKTSTMLGAGVIHDRISPEPQFPLDRPLWVLCELSLAQLVPADGRVPARGAGRLDSHDADRDPSKLFTALLSASQSQKVLPAKDMLSLSLSRRDQGSQRQPKVEDAVGATLSRSWQENTEPYSSAKPHKLHIFRKTDRNWKLQLCLIGGEEQKENLAPRRNAERGNVSSALEPLLLVFCCR